MAGTHGHGTTLAGATALGIGSITKISIGGISVDDLDVSTMASTDKWREFISGMIDAGEISFDLIFDGTVTATLFTKIGASDTWTVTFPDTGAATFSAPGYIKGISIDDPYDDKITGSCTIKVSGKPTFTA